MDSDSESGSNPPLIGAEILLRSLVRYDAKEQFCRETMYPCVHTIKTERHGDVQKGVVFKLYYSSFPFPSKTYRKMPLGRNQSWNIEAVMYEHNETRQSVIASLEGTKAMPDSYLSTDFTESAPSSRLTGCSLGLSVAACVLGLPNFAYTGWITPYSIDPSDLTVGPVKGIGAKMKFCRDNRIPFFLAAEALKRYKEEARSNRSVIDEEDQAALDKSDFNRYYNISTYMLGAPFSFSIYEAIECNSLVEVIVLSLAIANQLAYQERQ